MRSASMRGFSGRRRCGLLLRTGAAQCRTESIRTAACRLCRPALARVAGASGRRARHAHSRRRGMTVERAAVDSAAGRFVRSGGERGGPRQAAGVGRRSPRRRGKHVGTTDPAESDKPPSPGPRGPGIDPGDHRQRVTAVVLAAGRGTRMRSDTPQGTARAGGTAGAPARAARPARRWPAARHRRDGARRRAGGGGDRGRRAGGPQCVVRAAAGAAGHRARGPAGPGAGPERRSARRQRRSAAAAPPGRVRRARGAARRV